MSGDVERQDDYLDRIPHYGVVRKLEPKTETSHTEDWEITFRATVPAGLFSSQGALYSAQAIVEQRITEALHRAGVADPQVVARKIGRSSHRGDYQHATEYDTGETVFWHGKLWMARKPSCNRPPHTGHDYWFETDVLHTADAIFAPPKELGPARRRLVEATNPSGDEIMVVEDIPEDEARRHVNEWALQELADNDIVDAEIVDEP